MIDLKEEMLKGLRALALEVDDSIVTDLLRRFTEYSDSVESQLLEKGASV